MLRRFAAATCVASPVVALATLIVLLAPDLKPESLYRLTSFCCILPAVWGLWAMLAPRSWVPQRLPLWGAILGALAGMMVAFVLNLPAQILEVALSAPQRGLVVLILAAFYYLLWLVVRAALGALAGNSHAAR
mgnify:CR=1 FL=1